VEDVIDSIRVRGVINMYGKIKESRLLNIEVYEEDQLLYKGKVEDAPKEIKETNYKSVEIKDGWVLYNV